MASLVTILNCHSLECCGIPTELQHNPGRSKRKHICSAVCCVLLRSGNAVQEMGKRVLIFK